MTIKNEITPKVLNPEIVMNLALENERIDHALINIVDLPKPFFTVGLCIKCNYSASTYFHSFWDIICHIVFDIVLCIYTC